MSQTGKDTWITADSGIQAIFIGFAYSALVFFSFPITGGSLNPAYAWAANCFNWIDTQDDNSIEFIWIYTVFPFVGMVFAYIIHQFLWVRGSKEAARNIEDDDGVKAVDNNRA